MHIIHGRFHVGKRKHDVELRKRELAEKHEKRCNTDLTCGRHMFCVTGVDEFFVPTLRTLIAAYPAAGIGSTHKQDSIA